MARDDEQQAMSEEWRRRITALPTQADIDRCQECWPNDWQAKITFYNGQVAALVDRVTQLENFAYRVSQIDLDESATMALWRMQEQARAVLASTEAEAGEQAAQIEWKKEKQTMANADREPDFTYDSDVVTAILTERERQRSRWSAGHDYGHNEIEWAGLLTAYVGRFVAATDMGSAQQSLIQVAALCVAAVQAIELSRFGPNPAAALNALDAHRKQQAAQGEA